MISIGGRIFGNVCIVINAEIAKKNYGYDMFRHFK